MPGNSVRWRTERGNCRWCHQSPATGGSEKGIMARVRGEVTAKVQPVKKGSIVAITKSDGTTGSSRARIYKVLSKLASRGWEGHIFPLDWGGFRWNGDEALALGVIARALGRTAIRCNLKARFAEWQLKRAVQRAWESSVVILQKVALSERWRSRFRRSGAVIIYDLDDLPGWLRDGADSEWRQRGLETVKASHLVVAGNKTLATILEKFHGRVRVIPTGVDTELYRPKTEDAEDEVFRIGWTGSQGALVDLLPYIDVIRRFPIEGDGKCVVELLGAGRDIARAKGFAWAPWSENLEAQRVPYFSAGLAPLSGTIESTCRCGYKLLLYMACGVPAIVSPAGVHSEYVREGLTGLFFNNSMELYSCLRQLKNDAGLRKEIGIRGREWVQKTMSVDVIADLWEGVLSNM